jgi:phospholipid/cholesterol/gamma-HCH transport system substrate-binding protein
MARPERDVLYAPKHLIAGTSFLAAFFVVSVLLFTVSDRRTVVEGTFLVSTRLDSLRGLRRGAAVQVSGLPAGEIAAIRQPLDPRSSFTVDMRIREPLRILLREDSTAHIATEGLLGESLIDIEAGSADAPPVAAGDVLPSREPVDFRSLAVQMLQTAGQAGGRLQDVAKRGAAAYDELLLEVRPSREYWLAGREHVRAVIKSSLNARRDWTELHSDLSRRTAPVHAALELPEVRATRGRWVRAGEELASTFRHGRAVAGQIGRLLFQATEAGATTDWRSGLAATRRAAAEGTADVFDVSTSLQGNALFQLILGGRALSALDSLSPAEYEQGVLDGALPRSLRIALPAKDIFTSHATEGRESLSERGKERLDRLVSRLRYYLPHSRVVVEGYSAIGSPSERFARAGERAYQVFNYLEARFNLFSGESRFLPLTPPHAESPLPGGGVILVVYYDHGEEVGPRHRTMR